MENNCSQPEWIGETTQELSCVKPVEAESLPEQRLLADLASSAHDSQQVGNETCNRGYSC